MWSLAKLAKQIPTQALAELSTLLYSSEAWTTYTRQEKKLNSFHLRCLRRILDISWQDKITNTEVLERASSFSMYTLLSQRRLRWLGHVHRMANGCIPKDMLYGELVTGTRTVGRPYLRYRDTCKRDMKVESTLRHGRQPQMIVGTGEQS